MIAAIYKPLLKSQENIYIVSCSLLIKHPDNIVIHAYIKLSCLQQVFDTCVDLRLSLNKEIDNQILELTAVRIYLQNSCSASSAVYFTATKSELYLGHDATHMGMGLADRWTYRQLDTTSCSHQTFVKRTKNIFIIIPLSNLNFILQ